MSDVHIDITDSLNDLLNNHFSPVTTEKTTVMNDLLNDNNDLLNDNNNATEQDSDDESSDDESIEARVIQRCQPSCGKLLSESDSRYLKKGERLYGAKCVTEGCSTIFDTNYLKYASIYYCKNYTNQGSHSCDFIVYMNCLPNEGKNRRQCVEAV